MGSSRIRARIRLAVAATSAVTTAITLAGCGAHASTTTAAFNTASTRVANASTAKGGTLTFVNSTDFDSPDPGNTYDNFVWDFAHYYARPLLSYANEPGKGSLKLEPDLATGLGQSSDGGRTWTYHIRSGVRYSNGQTVTAADVKYAIERSNWGENVLSQGPSYFRELIDPKAASGGQSWPGPYKDPKGSLPDSMIATPNATTIVFHLLSPFADFDYIAAMLDTAPVPRADDTGAQYQNHIISSGPYQIDSFKPGVGMTLSKNPYWNPATDPDHLHPQLADKIVLKTEIAANTVDDDLLSGQAQVDQDGGGVQAAAQARILASPTLKRNADDPETGFIEYAAINKNVSPFTDLACRQAVEFAANKVELRNQYGGPTAGAIATTILAPTVAGYTDYPNPYATPGDKGNVTKAKQLLATCRSRLGAKFTPDFAITVPENSPALTAAATALGAELSQVGFKPRIAQFASSTYGNDFAGAPSYANTHGLGIMFSDWDADFPTGYAVLQPLVNGSDLQPSGNNDLSQLDDPTINREITTAAADPDTARQDAEWGQIDRQVMNQAVILPILYAKALLYRPPSLTNVMVTYAYGMYDYAPMGVTK
jgi:peptide/nickel transport system substrate-binding protein